MKNLIFIAALLLVTGNFINAQTDTVYISSPSDTVTVMEARAEAAPAESNIERVSYNRDVRDRFQFGFKAGANYSNIYDVASENFAADYKFGIAAGIFMSIPLGKYLGVQPEFLYSEKGYESTGSVEGSTFDNKRTAKYLDIPLYLQLKPNEVLTVLFGPQVSFLLDKDNDYSNSFLTDEQEQEADNIDINKFTFGLSGGLDLNIGHVVLGGRAGWDLTQNDGLGTAVSPRYRNMWYQATLGFRF
jgi:opacity protein-like surface antigen